MVTTASVILLVAMAIIGVVYIMRRAKAAWDEQLAARNYTGSRFDSSAQDLRVVLDDAIAVNTLNDQVNSSPSVYLDEAFRATPSAYKSGLSQILPRFRSGQIISVDLKKMSNYEAARLVDFCSGMTAMSGGWIFRVTDDVLVLTPRA